MRITSHHLGRLGLVAILVSVLIIACQGNVEKNLASQSPVTETETCRIVEHDAGETEICGQPQTIAALSPRVLDPMLALDLQPAAYAEAAYADRSVLSLDKFDNPSQQIPHLGDRITTQPINLGHRNTPSLETLVEINPDLIVAETWQENELFSQIAPVILLNNNAGKDGWIRRLQILAQAFGREDQSERVMAQYQEKLAEARTKLAPVINIYPRILPIDFNGSIFYVYSYSSSIAALLEELGFQLMLLEGLPRETAHSPEAPQISIEALVQLDPDIILVVAWDKNNLYNPEPAAKHQWEEIALLQTMQAVNEGRIRFVSGQLWGGTRDGPIAYHLMLEQLPDLLLPFIEEK